MLLQFSGVKVDIGVWRSMWVDFNKRGFYLLVIYFKIHEKLSFAALIPGNRYILIFLTLHVLYFVDCNDGSSFGYLID